MVKKKTFKYYVKIHLLKTYALSKLNYILFLVIVPHWVYKEVAQFLFEFIWRRNDQIKWVITY